LLVAIKPLNVKKLAEHFFALKNRRLEQLADIPRLRPTAETLSKRPFTWTPKIERHLILLEP
jgi:hypothetical protein